MINYTTASVTRCGATTTLPLRWSHCTSKVSLTRPIDQETLRSVHELTPESAKDLDRLLPPINGYTWMTKVETNAGHVYIEGAVRQITINAYERNPQTRAVCIAHWG
jgi:hypothetical protein